LLITRSYSQLWIPTSGPTGGEIFKIAVHPTNPKIVYVINFSGFYGVYKSTNGGNTWSVATKGLETDVFNGMYRAPKDFVIDMIHPETVYVAVSNILGQQGWSKLYRSVDGGNHWSSLLAGTVSAMYANNGFVVASVDSNLVVSTDAGTSWRVQRKQFTAQE
jgi:photosystem II stability/assembly factor-like uncharacterized protein